MLFWAGFSALQAQDENYSFRQLNTNDGLSQSTVYSILQDRQGFLWFGTRTGGLNRFDGRSFKHYKKDISNASGLSGNEVVAIFQGSDGIIWLGTRGDGLSRFDPELERFEQYYHDPEIKNSVSSNTVVGFCEDAQGRIWMATTTGLCRYNGQQNNFIRVLNSKTGADFGQTLDIIRAGDGHLAIATKQSGIYVLDASTGAVQSHFQHEESNDASININYVSTLLYDTRGRLWAGTRNNGLNVLPSLDSTRFQQIEADATNPTSLSSNIIRVLDEDRQGNIWVGTKEGLDMIPASETGSKSPAFVHFKNDPVRSNSLSQNSIYSFEEDKDGHFWVGTWSGGVNYLNSEGNKFNLRQRQIGRTKGAINHAVSAFAKTKEGLWIGTEGGGLKLQRKGEGSFTSLSEMRTVQGRLKSDHIKSLFVDRGGDLWIGTYNGLHRFHLKDNTIRYFLPGKSIYSIEESRLGKLWIGTGDGLFLLDQETLEQTNYTVASDDPGSLSSKSINKLFLDSRKRLWVATKNGLNLYDHTTDAFVPFFHSREDRSSLSNNVVTTVYEDAKGQIWIGTVDGLNQFVETDSSFVHFGEKNGLPDNVVNSILTDQEGNLWLTTNKGLSRFNPMEEQQGVDSKFETEGRAVKNYSQADGLQGNEFIVNATYKDGQGRFYFGGSEGYNSFRPREITENENIPDVVITGFTLFNNPVPIGEEGSPLDRHISATTSLELTHEQSVFSFQFVALNYHSAEKNEYAYMLEGLDDDWNFIGNRREVSYSNLPPGDYVFRVLASNNDGRWNRQGAALNLVVLPPWWRTPWFIGAALATICLLVVLGVRLRLRKLKNDRLMLQTKLDEGRAEIVAQQEQVEKQEKELQLRDEREQDMKWYNRGFIELSTVISEHRDDLDNLSELFLSKLLIYVGAQMGGIYMAMEENEERWLELRASYAADAKRLSGLKVGVDEGLVGACFQGKEKLQVDELPDDFAHFSSGLGEVNLQHLLLVPIKFEEEVEGVIELISIEKLEGVQVELVESIGKQFAALLTTRKANHKVQQMLLETAEKKEELAAQEEELRQTIEELTVTQEETQRREQHLLDEIAKLKSESI